MVPQRGRQLSYRMAGFRLAITEVIGSGLSCCSGSPGARETAVITTSVGRRGWLVYGVWAAVPAHLHGAGMARQRSAVVSLGDVDSRDERRPIVGVTRPANAPIIKCEQRQGRIRRGIVQTTVQLADQRLGTPLIPSERRDGSRSLTVGARGAHERPAPIAPWRASKPPGVAATRAAGRARRVAVAYLPGALHEPTSARLCPRRRGCRRRRRAHTPTPAVATVAAGWCRRPVASA